MGQQDTSFESEPPTEVTPSFGDDEPTAVIPIESMLACQSLGPSTARVTERDS